MVKTKKKQKKNGKIAQHSIGLLLFVQPGYQSSRRPGDATTNAHQLTTSATQRSCRSPFGNNCLICGRIKRWPHKKQHSGLARTSQLWAFKVKWWRVKWLKPGECDAHTCVLCVLRSTGSAASCHVFPVNMIRGKLSVPGIRNPESGIRHQCRVEMNRKKFWSAGKSNCVTKCQCGLRRPPKVCSTPGQPNAVNYETVKSKRCHESKGSHIHTSARQG